MSDMSREMFVRFSGIAFLVGGLIMLRWYEVDMWWQMGAAALGWGFSLGIAMRVSPETHSLVMRVLRRKA